ncbi:nucleotidyltransferase family protein [Limoniibacter endophyticus]|uniref:Mannose-1-phosphate guanylyltransferase n=1 Tax=Limoniibacter endophyticus TaxID=1565040 RepID=A0A8J3DIG6_9HYPH|nr:nucleotidyltransferase family protein [Limoniibacter endophyticus]GHC74577.1 mannose-1-phosphate guanylyltransferase [Limoniibacter endophyticus]
MSAVPRQAVVLAAGLGTRLRPITDTIPKPLVRVGGKPMLDWVLDALEEVGVEKVFLNVHHLADQIESHVAKRNSPDITISDERRELLDSGGGVEKILPLMNPAPFFLLNSDTFWLDDEEPNLSRLASTWDDRTMDMLLMLAKPEQATGHGAKTDFLREPAGRLARSPNRESGYIYAGAAIIHPRIFERSARGRHSLNVEFDAAIAKGRLFGWLMHGKWLTVGTPDAIESAETVIRQFRMSA